MSHEILYSFEAILCTITFSDFRLEVPSRLDIYEALVSHAKIGKLDHLVVYLVRKNKPSS